MCWSQQPLDLGRVWPPHRAGARLPLTEQTSPLLTCRPDGLPASPFEEPLLLPQPARPVPSPPYAGDGLASLPRGPGTGNSCLHLPHPQGQGSAGSATLAVAVSPFPPLGTPMAACPKSSSSPHGLLRGSGLPLLSQDHPPPGQLTQVQPVVPSRSHATGGRGGAPAHPHCPVEQPAALPQPLEAGLPWSSPGPDCSGHLCWGVCAPCPGFGSRRSRLSGWKLPQSRNIAWAGLQAPSVPLCRPNEHIP